jgi:Zn-dependent M28 family amino/carboxypeptidase
MHCAKAVVIALAATPVVLGMGFNGARALEFTRKAVSFGPRPPNSAEIAKLRSYIEADLKPLHCQVIEDPFTASTPLGPMPMINVIAKFPGTSGRAIVFTGHYDTKLFPGRRFVGANDGGSSTGFLLEMAHVIATVSHKDDIYLVWFDGEEAIANWSATDGIHGSRHLAAKWESEGVLGRIKALVNVDMIGDKDLAILQETEGSAPLTQLVWRIAHDLGYGKYFLDAAGSVEDDHMPFVRRGVNAIDLIDFDYGPENSWWHTDQDTMDKLNAHSFQVVGDVLVELIRRLSAS